MSTRDSRAAIILLASCVLIVGGAFWAGRMLGATPPAVADPAAPLPQDLEKLTPAPGETPDFRQPFWYAKWVNADNELPRYDQVVAGIRVGPTATRSGGPCDDKNRPTTVEFAAAQGSSVDIQPSFLPPGARLTSAIAVKCAGEVALAYALYELPLADDLEERLAGGESFFAIPRGGSIEILRFVGDPAEESSIAAERWTEGTIAGYPAAIGRPILDEGFGPSMAAVYVDGVMTVVRGYHLSLEDLIRVAEGVLR